MSSAATKPRFLRLQFSLRALLVLITLVASGLTVYRWPWTVEQLREANYQHRQILSITHWRRGWSGIPEKHGSDLEMQFELHRGEEKIFTNGGLTSIRTFLDGEPQDYRRFKNGGLYPAEISGVWTSTKQHGDETVTQQCAWRNAQRHGLSTWTSSNGKVLQSAEFDRGRIVKWNGEPVADALKRWVKERVEKTEHQEFLLTALTKRDDYICYRQTHHGYLWGEDPRLLIVNCFLGKAFAGPTAWLPRYEGLQFAYVVLETALHGSGTLDFRYGSPSIVPICTSELNWQDPTNIKAVKFAPESPAAEAWKELAHIDLRLTGWPAEQLRLMCVDKTIKVDTSAVNHLDPPPYSGLHGSTLPDYPRPFCDFFGHILYDAGYRCEQRGDTIVVLPQRAADSPTK